MGGIQVSACETTTDACASDDSDPDTGEFAISGLVAGTYTVLEQDPTNLHLRGYYGGDGIFQASEDDAVAVAVPGVSIELLAVAAPQIQGAIINADLVGVQDLNVNVCDVDQENCFGAAAPTNSSGEYAGGCRSRGTYSVQVFDPTDTYPSGGYITDAQTVDPDSGATRLVAVTDSTVPGVDATIPYGGLIAVDVWSGTEQAQFAFVQVCRSEFVCPEAVNTDEFGDGFSPVPFPGTIDASTTVDFEHFDWWVDDMTVSADFADAGPVAVTGGANTPITIWLPGGGTPTDAGEEEEPVTVELEDEFGNTPVEMTFTASPRAARPPSPSPTPATRSRADSEALGLPATYYDITTTAEYVVPITICISYAGVSFENGVGLTLFHFDAAIPGWDDITTEIRSAEEVICGETNSLSPFVIAERTYAFSAFFGPKAPPQLNDAKAGTTIGLQFSLGGNFGLDIFEPGWPVLQRIDCATGATIGVPDTTTVSLKYNKRTDRYTFSFGTQKAWKNTCRSLTITLRDGTSAAVWYRLKA